MKASKNMTTYSPPIFYYMKYVMDMAVVLMIAVENKVFQPFFGQCYITKKYLNTSLHVRLLTGKHVKNAVLRFLLLSLTVCSRKITQ